MNLLHSARRTSESFGSHILDRRCPLTEDWVCQNIHPIDFNQNCGMAQPCDSQPWTRAREVWVLHKVWLHHRELTIQGL